MWLNAVTPILLGLGLLGIYLEFKAGGHGLFAGVGAALLAVVFFGHYVAGLSGHEPAVIFALGLLLVVVEIFFFPGVALPALLGLAMMLGSLVWAMADIWPSTPVAFSGDIFLSPMANLGAGLGIATVLALVLFKYLPESWLWGRLVLQQSIGANAQTAGTSPETTADLDALIGATGTAVTGLFPSGEVEIDGRRYQARLDLGHIAAGTPVVVKSRSDFGLIVERKDP
jgi:membrane-bound serine protease (ClpP class)